MMFGAVVLTVLLALEGSAPAGPPPAEQDAPDPRRGERLDGRPGAASDPPANVALRALASPARRASWLVLAPVDRTVGWLERKKIPQHIYEALTSDDRLVGVAPVIRYEPGYALSIGGHLYDQRTLGPGSHVDALLRAGARSMESSFSIQPPGHAGLRLHLSFSRRNDFVYGGVRGETMTELRASGQDIARYHASTALAALNQRRSAGRFVLIDGTASIEQRLFGNGIQTGSTPPIWTVFCGADAAACRIDPAVLPGFSDGVRLARAQLRVTVDTRNSPRFGAGMASHVAATFSEGFAGDPSRHVSLTARGSGFLPFGDRALSVHLSGGVVEALGGARIPFDELLSASGPDAVRGIARGRLRGPSALVGSVEYRWLLSPALDAVLFVDRGNAFGPRFSDLRLDRMFTSAGVALLVLQSRENDYWKNIPVFYFQVAVSADGGAHLSFAANTLR